METAQLDGFVFGEHVTVSVKWLCFQLSLGAAEAQTLLDTFAAKNAKSLRVLHLITGRINGGLGVRLVGTAQLQVERAKFDACTVNVHSVQAIDGASSSAGSTAIR
jgi:hypothetical protein